MAEEIIPNLYVGDLNDALQWKGFLLCVLEIKPSNEPENATWIPILDSRLGTANVQSLRSCCNVIDAALKREDKVLVHCGAGVERSPLTVAWYLHECKGMTLQAAYDLLRSKRSVVQDRRMWLPEEFRNG